ncbi:MAG: hypothetical protein AAF629_15985 [Chloroflexota bacterium]
MEQLNGHNGHNGHNGYKNKAHKNGYNGFKPVIIRFPQDSEAEKYELAYSLVQHIDETLTAGTQHYRTKSGHLLRTLDEVINAILADNLVWEGETPAWGQDLARAA